jgi:PqqD family protein of HPr-rel-A system
VLLLTKWTARSGDLLWRAWDDEESVVYHVPSGNTHVLNRVSALVLRHLEDRWLTPTELASLLARSLDRPWDEELCRCVAELLVGFDQRGLVEPAP